MLPETVQSITQQSKRYKIVGNSSDDGCHPCHDHWLESVDEEALD
jgi:hypothetical protein